MPERLAIIAALPREVQLLVRGVKSDLSAGPGILVYRLPHAVVVAAGMGAARVSLAVQAALRHGPLSQVISVGLAGACRLAFKPGEVIEPHWVVDARTGERFETAGAGSEALLVSAAEIASVTEKARLAATYGAGLVDMEAATVARLAQAHGVPFRAVKGISDAFDFELASLGRFTGQRGQFRTAAFALHTATHPGEWKRAIELGRNSSRALQAMTERLRELIG